MSLDNPALLQDAGVISAKIAKDYAESEFEKYRSIQNHLFESDFDKESEAIERQVAIQNQNGNRLRSIDR